MDLSFSKLSKFKFKLKKKKNKNKETNNRTCSVYLNKNQNPHEDFNWYGLEICNCKYFEQNLNIFDVNMVPESTYKCEFPKKTYLFICSSCYDFLNHKYETNPENIYRQFPEINNQYWYLFPKNKYHDEYDFIEIEDNKIKVLTKNNKRLINILTPYFEDELVKKPIFTKL